VCPAQVSTSRLEGQVTDQSGAAVVGATVTAINARTQASLAMKTNEQGFYIFPSLAPSTYRLTVEVAGFRKAQVEKIELNVSVSVTENVRLEVGSVAESVTVEASALRVQTTDAQIGRQVTLRDIDTLPQLARGPLALVAFVPGASVNPGDTTFTRINGNRQGSNNVKLDGIDANDAVVPRLGLSLTSVNTDSVEEFRIVTNGGKAEYGRNAGGQVEMITRSGTNRFSGNLFEYLRNTKLNANNFFSNSAGVPRPVFIQSIFGGSIGGPVIKDKMFFFFNYQGRRTAQQTERNRTVLSAEARQGIFRWRVPGSGELRSFNIVSGDPLGRGMDAKTRELIGLLPASNNSDVGDGLNTLGFRFNNPSGSRENQLTGKIDHNLTSAHRLFFRYSRQENSFIDALNNADAAFPGRPQGTQGGIRWGYSIGSDWSIQPTLINEFRFGHQSASVDFLRPDRIKGPQIVPNLYTNPILAAFAQGRNSPVYDFTDNMTWVKGKSTWKWGVTIRHTLQYGWNDAGAFPNISLSTANANVPASTIGPNGAAVIATADRQRFESLYNDILGNVSSTAVTYYSNLQQFQAAGTGRIRNLKFMDYGSFVQNDYKLKPNLTVNIGLRWDVFAAPQEMDGFQGELDKIGQVNDAARINDFKVGRASAWYKTDWQNWAPRLGFAWDPFRDGKTSVRGGYGMFFDRIVGATSSLVDGNTPGFTQPLTNLAGLDFPVGTRVSDNPRIPAQPATVPLQNAVNRNASVVVFRPDIPTGYTHQLNLVVQREMLKNTIVDVGYVRTQGHALFAWRDMNQPRIYGDFLTSFQELQAFQASGRAPSANNTLVRLFGTPATAVTRLGATTLSQNLAGSAADTVDRTFFATMATAGVSEYYFRNFPQYNQFIYGDAIGRLWYDSLQLSVRRTTGNLRTSMNYTLSKSIDNGSVDGNGFTAPIDNANLNLNRGRGDFDRPHSFNWTASYILPFGKGQRWMSSAPAVVNQVFGGWELGMLGLWQSGTVMTASSGRRTAPSSSNTWINYSGSRNIGALERRGDGVYFFTPSQVSELTASASFPLAGEIGTSGRNSFRGPRFFNTDLSLVKRFHMPWERHYVNFRAEIYNFFNNPNFGQPGFSIATPQTFGRISSTVGNARIWQMALRYDF
jgi:hypothetical protein